MSQTLNYIDDIDIQYSSQALGTPPAVRRQIWLVITMDENQIVTNTNHCRSKTLPWFLTVIYCHNLSQE